MTTARGASGLGPSGNRSEEESYKETTSELSSSTYRRQWMGPFDLNLSSDDSNSD